MPGLEEPPGSEGLLGLPGSGLPGSGLPEPGSPGPDGFVGSDGFAGVEGSVGELGELAGGEVGCSVGGPDGGTAGADTGGGTTAGGATGRGTAVGTASGRSAVAPVAGSAVTVFVAGAALERSTSPLIGEGVDGAGGRSGTPGARDAEPDAPLSNMLPSAWRTGVPDVATATPMTAVAAAARPSSGRATRRPAGVTLAPPARSAPSTESTIIVAAGPDRIVSVTPFGDGADGRSGVIPPLFTSRSTTSLDRGHDIVQISYSVSNTGATMATVRMTVRDGWVRQRYTRPERPR